MLFLKNGRYFLDTISFIVIFLVHLSGKNILFS